MQLPQADVEVTDLIWRPRFQQHMSLRSSRLLRVVADSRYMSWRKACSSRAEGRSWRDRAVCNADSSLKTADIVVPSVLAGGRGSEPARLRPTLFTDEPARPGMVSLSSIAGTEVKRWIHNQGHWQIRMKGVSVYMSVPIIGCRWLSEMDSSCW